MSNFNVDNTLNNSNVYNSITPDLDVMPDVELNNSMVNSSLNSMVNQTV